MWSTNHSTNILDEIILKDGVSAPHHTLVLVKFYIYNGIKIVVMGGVEFSYINKSIYNETTELAKTYLLKQLF